MAMRESLKLKKRRPKREEQQPQVRSSSVVRYTLPNGRALTVEADAAALFERSLVEHAEIWAELAKS